MLPRKTSALPAAETEQGKSEHMELGLWNQPCLGCSWLQADQVQKRQRLKFSLKTDQEHW